MSRIDSATAKKLVPAVMKVELAKMMENDKFKTILDCSKLSKVKAGIEKEVRRMFADCLLSASWEGRSYAAVAVVPVAPSEANARPYYGMLRYIVVNARSKFHTAGTAAIIGTHVLERLLERKHSSELVNLLREEFDWSFIEAIGMKATELKDTDYTECSCKLKTKNGWACMVFTPDETPVITTWYR